MKLTINALATALVIVGSAHAAVSAEEAMQLGRTLTPWGALKAGNADGSIPPYEGGLPVTTAPKGFVPNSGHWPDPLADEKPLYSITAQNMSEYADKLSEVTKEMLKRFPTFRVDVYPTHRTANYPAWFLENSIKNATRCKTKFDELALENCFGGTPFPIPKSGKEQMWNVELGFAKPWHSIYESVYVNASGMPITSVVQDIFMDSPYYDPKLTMEAFYGMKAPWFRGSGVNRYPPRIAGDGQVLLYYIDPVTNPNKSWNYQQGNRRVRYIPDAQYDYPLLHSGGAQFFDEIQMFSGKMDRFDFKLLGVKEMFIPYNTQRTSETPKETLVAVGGGHHPNPARIRWELHRVRVVEATLKTAMRHAYAKRRFYLDEDYPRAGLADAWNHAGKLYRGNFILFAWAYDKQTPFLSNIVFDLTTGVWFITNVVAGQPGFTVLDAPQSDAFYTPEGLTRRSPR